ncbi:MAG: hypothetical protein B7Z66_12350 [Chromatiales bacterium 21-64-14]|nr:MAG: hypothetical protein B7Z66_12350 [Chromatiales bacterium 21-64-14]HQU16975.1 DUF99 family protein [Gammaproteobacteria bacterium]
MSAHRPHVIGFDDAPFASEHRGDVRVVGAVYTGLRLDGVLFSKVRRDGINATRRLVEMVSGSRFMPRTHVLLLQGIALAGFNVVDVNGLYDALRIPVIVVVRKTPDLDEVRRALSENMRGGRRKLALIHQAGPVEPIAGVFVQRVGIESVEAERMIRALAVHSAVPEPLRTAHIIAGAMTRAAGRYRRGRA